MPGEQPMNPLSTCIACEVLQPALRSLLLFDVPFAGLQQAAQQTIEIAAQVGQKLRPIIVGSTEYDDDLWGERILPGNHGKMEAHAQIFLPPKDSDETLLLIIPDLSMLSLAVARTSIMLVGADVAHLERYGQQGVWSPRYYWLASCRQDAIGSVSPHLLDRFALRLAWKFVEQLSHQDRVRALQRNMQQEPFTPLLPLNPTSLQHLKLAAQHPPLIEITSEACELIMAYQEGEIFHQRRELALARCALALAQFSGDAQLLASHVEQAAKIMGLQQQAIHDDTDSPPDIEEPELPTPSIEGPGPLTPESAGQTSSKAQPAAFAKNIEVQMPERSEQEAIDYIMATANPYPEDIEPILREAASLQIPQQHFKGTRPDRGPIIGVEPSTTLRDLSLVSTLMRALLFQAFRAKHDEIVLDWTDLRKYRRAAEPEQLLLLLLDYTSLPLAQRQKALVPYIAQAYIDRASVTIVKVGASASGTKHPLRAEMVSARSILVPAISEAIDAPAGNATPLAHGLELALQVIQRALQHGRSSVQHITFVVVSDGRGNVPLQASHRNTITPPIAREGVDDALAKAQEVGKIKHVSSVVLSPRLRYYQVLPQRLATALHAQLVCLDDEEDKQ